MIRKGSVYTSTCECSDIGCPYHKGYSQCTKLARQVLRRVDMVDTIGTAFCNGCANDAMESGLFF